jgi:hypothetical protein
VEEQFAINYFRKIFNLTVSMPYSEQMQELLTTHIQKLYDWEDQEIEAQGRKVGKKAKKLAETISELGLEAEISSVRKYLNVAHNFYAFLKFNPNYVFDPEVSEDFVICLLIVKEAWQPLYEEMMQMSLQQEEPGLETVVKRLKEQHPLSQVQNDFLTLYFEENASFKTKKIAEERRSYPTLA